MLVRVGVVGCCVCTLLVLALGLTMGAGFDPITGRPQVLFLMGLTAFAVALWGIVLCAVRPSCVRILMPARWYRDYYGMVFVYGALLLLLSFPLTRSVSKTVLINVSKDLFRFAMHAVAKAVSA